MSSKPLVSVLIPTHNRADLLLERCLPSVLAQTYRNLEIIIANHGTDEEQKSTREAIYRLTRQGEYGIRFSKRTVHTCRVIRLDVSRHHHYPMTPENRWFAGPVEPLNEALKHVTGDWIARIDDDDEWTPNHIKDALEFAQMGKFEFVSAAHETHEGRVEPYRYWKNDEQAWMDPITGAAIGPGLEHRASIGGTQTWIWRSYLKMFKWNPDCYRKKHNRVNDVDISVRMMQAGVRMGYLPSVHAKVLPRPGETSVGLKAYLEKDQSHVKTPPPMDRSRFDL